MTNIGTSQQIIYSGPLGIQRRVKTTNKKSKRLKLPREIGEISINYFTRKKNRLF